MAEFWIVTSRKYAQHASLRVAETERDRLMELFPDRAFRVMRCKGALQSARHFPRMVALLRAIVADGLTIENLAGAKELLASVEARTPSLAPVSIHREAA